MLQTGGCPSLAQEALADVLGAQEMRREHLDGDLALEENVAREIDNAHSAPAERSLDREAANEGLLQRNEFCVHSVHLSPFMVVSRQLQSILASRVPHCRGKGRFNLRRQQLPFGTVTVGARADL